MMIAKAGEAWESSQQHEFYSHEAKKGVRKLRPSRRTRFRKLPRCYSFSNHAVSSPPDDGCEDARRPTGHLRDDPLISVLMMGSLRTSQAAGGFTITPHTPGVQCCTKRARQRNLIASEYSCVRGLQNQILHNQVDPEKHFLGNSVFHSPRLHRHGVEWRGSLIKTEFKPGALKNLLSCRSSDYNVVDSVFPEYKSWGVLLASWPQTWSIQAFLYGEEQS